MSIEVWLAFVIASSVLTLVPGPCVLLVVSQALTRGMSAALMCILGDIVGGIALMILSLVGVGAILAASATLFTIFKWLGVLYMAYLGCSQILAARKRTSEGDKEAKQFLGMGSFKAGFFASLLNPKAIIFYMAFLPQFMNPETSALLQFSILIITSAIVIGVILAGYALIASRARKAFQSTKSRKYFDYSGGSFLIGSSVYMANAAK
ncbi:MAG: LysE family translocator [Pseudomonadales bacterium]|nr:LysE family translocator [Pseudomonadales bacterium]NRA14778.1 LysE family translocator [Oceanospirillaceae bacterium]